MDIKLNNHATIMDRWHKRVQIDNPNAKNASKAKPAGLPLALLKKLRGEKPTIKKGVEMLKQMSQTGTAEEFGEGKQPNHGNKNRCGKRKSDPIPWNH